MRRIILSVLLVLSFASWSYAGQGMGPGPGVMGYPGNAASKIIATPSGIILVTGTKWVSSPGTQSWERLVITPNGTPLKTADNKILKTL
jgi:hypothetical protein